MEIKTKADAEKVLRGWQDLNEGPIATVKSLLNKNGYFEVPHFLLSYIDFLSGLASGKGRNSKSSDMRAYFKKYFPSAYVFPSAWLIYQFRNGLVHEFKPKVICMDNKEVGWHISLKPDEHHLKIRPSEKRADFFNLHLSAPEFLEDFLVSVECFRQEIHSDDPESDDSALKKFIKGYDAFSKPVNIDKITSEPKEIKNTEVAPYVTNEDKTWLKNQIAAFNK